MHKAERRRVCIAVFADRWSAHAPLQQAQRYCQAQLLSGRNGAKHLKRDKVKERNKIDKIEHSS